MRTPATALLVLALAAAAPAQQRSLDEFFRDFTADWVRQNPNQAASTRLFTGDEQRQFERQMTPFTPEWRRRRVALARTQPRGAAQTFDRARLDGERSSVSAELMRLAARDVHPPASRYNDYFFPFEQFGGVNVGLVSLMTVNHPIATEADAQNYVARLGQVAPRLDEAIAEARRIAELGLDPSAVHPPRHARANAAIRGRRRRRRTRSSRLSPSRMAAPREPARARGAALRGRGGADRRGADLSGLEEAIALLQPLEGEGYRRCRLVAVQRWRRRLR